MNLLLAVLASVIGFFVAVFVLVLAGAIRGEAFDGGLIGTMYFAGVAASYALLKRWFAAPVVTLGSDGIAVEALFAKRRIPRWEIAAVTVPVPGGPLVVHRHRGASVTVDGVLVDRALVDTVAAEADRRLRVDAVHPRAAAFERGERDVKSWKTALRGTLDAGYREAGASVEDAGAVLASPGSTIDQRLGAALALRVAGEPPERIRVAAESIVDPAMRDALEAIADDEDERLEKTLRKLG